MSLSVSPPTTPWLQIEVSIPITWRERRPSCWMKLYLILFFCEKKLYLILEHMIAVYLFTGTLISQVISNSYLQIYTEIWCLLVSTHVRMIEPTGLFSVIMFRICRIDVQILYRSTWLILFSIIGFLCQSMRKCVSFSPLPVFLALVLSCLFHSFLYL
jgi:hypothetical protein